MSSKRATANIPQECEDILTNVTVELEEHIRKINSNLQTLFVQGAGCWSRMPLSRPTSSRMC
jgi:hypothetical protein